MSTGSITGAELRAAIDRLGWYMQTEASGQGATHPADRIIRDVERHRGPGSLSVPPDEYPAFRVAVADAGVPASGASGRDPSAAPEQARERMGADPREPLVMPQDEFGLVKWLQDALAEAIGPAWGHAAVGCALEAVTPVVEHAARAAAGSHEGVRLWMLDCHALAAKYWDRAQQAEAKLAAIAEHRNAACAALRIAETQARYPAGDEATAERYRAAREALEGAGSERTGNG